VSPADRTPADEAVDRADEFLETTPTPEAENDAEGTFATLFRGTSACSFGFGP
jgi:hypothetical protein